MYALIQNDQIVQVGPLSSIWWDGDRWHDLRDDDGTYAASLGWLPITYEPRPDDTATTTWVRDEPTLVDGLPVIGWIERPKTEAELAAEAEQNARLDDLEERLARIEAKLWPADPDPEPDAPIDAPTWGDYVGIWPNGQLLSDGDTTWRNVSGVPLTSPPSAFPGSPGQWTHLFVEVTTADPDPEWPQWRGEWSADASYVPGDHVTRGGVVYRCLVAHGPEQQGAWGPPATGVWTTA